MAHLKHYSLSLISKYEITFFLKVITHWYCNVWPQLHSELHLHKGQTGRSGIHCHLPPQVVLPFCYHHLISTENGKKKGLHVIFVVIVVVHNVPRETVNAVTPGSGLLH